MFKIAYFLLKDLPSLGFINRLRTKIYRKYFCKSGINNTIGRSVNIANIHNIEIGNNVAINAETYLVASNSKIIIGNNVLIAPRCVLQSQNHRYKNKNELIRNQGTESKEIIIEDDVWLGTNCIVLPGVRIAKGSVVGAGSIVTKNTDPYSVNVGVPARKISKRT